MGRKLNPATIRIGGRTYDVRYTDQMEENHIGEAEYINLSIKIKPGLKPEIELEVLIHECIHQMMALNGWGERLGHEEEEMVVTALGAQFADLFKSNPHLVKHLAKL